MKRQSKFNVKKDKTDRIFDGIVFDSAIEMRYYKEVVLPKYNSGEIIKFERQKRYVLQPKYKKDGKTVLPIEYKADFYIVYKNGKEQVIDIKGCPDAVAKLKRKMFWYVFPELDYIWVAYSAKDGGFLLYETVQKCRKDRKRLKEQKEKKDG